MGRLRAVAYFELFLLSRGEVDFKTLWRRMKTTTFDPLRAMQHTLLMHPVESYATYDLSGLKSSKSSYTNLKSISLIHNKDSVFLVIIKRECRGTDS